MGFVNPHQLELPTNLAVGSVNAYLFPGCGPTLIDTGPHLDSTLTSLQTQLKTHRMTLANLERIVITHAHVDHFGLAAEIVRHSGARLMVPPQSVPWLTETAPWRQQQRRHQSFFRCLGLPEAQVERMIAGMRALEALAEPLPPAQIQTLPPNTALTLGTLVWHTIALPGHTRYQLGLHQREHNLLISADALLPVTTVPLIEWFEPDGRRWSSLPRLVQTLRYLQSLGLKRVYPGHGPVIGDPDSVLAVQLARIEKRKHQCLGLVADGLGTVRTLMAKMYPNYAAGSYFTGLCMLVGYLDLLQTEGSIAWYDDPSGRRYEPTEAGLAILRGLKQ